MTDVPPIDGQPSGAARPPSTIEIVKVSSIAAPKRPSPLNETVIEHHMLSIHRAGLLSPLLVIRVPNSDAFLLIAGAHRLEALRRLGLTEVQVNIREGDAEEVEMDHLEENLARKELSVMERAFQERRLFELYTTKHPKTLRGIAGAIARHKHATERISFAVAMARPRSGPRTIRDRLSIAKHLQPEAASVLYGTPAANRLACLKSLSKLPQEEQVRVAKVLAEESTTSVPQAVQSLLGSPKLVAAPKANEVVVALELVDGKRRGVVNISGRKYSVALATEVWSLTLRDIGKADLHRAYPNDDDLLTSNTWATTIQELIAELPAPVARDIQVDAPQRLELDGSVQSMWTPIRVKRKLSDGVLALKVEWAPSSAMPPSLDGRLREGVSSGRLAGLITGSLTVGHFRKEFRQFFSHQVLKKTHRTTDAFGVTEEKAAKPHTKASSAGGKPGPRKAAPRGNDVKLKLKFVLGKQQFKAGEVSKALEHLCEDIEAGTDFKDLLVKAIQFLTPPKSAHD